MSEDLFCECKTPEHGEDWVAMGWGQNVMDYQICEVCKCPIMGTQATHDDDGGEVEGTDI